VPAGADLTLLEMLFDELSHKVENGLTDNAFEAGIRRLVRYLPTFHIFPNSPYLVRGTVGARTWEQFQVHVCSHPDCIGWVYPYLDPSEYDKHKNDKCGVPGCKQKRFQVMKRGAAELVVPRWWYIDFGLEQVGSVGVCERGATTQHNCGITAGRIELCKGECAVRGFKASQFLVSMLILRHHHYAVRSVLMSAAVAPPDVVAALTAVYMLLGDPPVLQGPRVDCRL